MMTVNVIRNKPVVTLPITLTQIELGVIVTATKVGTVVTVDNT